MKCVFLIVVFVYTLCMYGSNVCVWCVCYLTAQLYCQCMSPLMFEVNSIKDVLVFVYHYSCNTILIGVHCTIDFLF